jgi:hypothetical protein
MKRILILLLIVMTGCYSSFFSKPSQDNKQRDRNLRSIQCPKQP